MQLCNTGVLCNYFCTKKKVSCASCLPMCNSNNDTITNNVTIKVTIILKFRTAAHTPRASVNRAGTHHIRVNQK